jgi:hypothetical protein
MTLTWRGDLPVNAPHRTGEIPASQDRRRIQGGSDKGRQVVVPHLDFLGFNPGQRGEDGAT